jgi:hypothetical protein
MPTWNTPYSKTNPSHKIAIAARPNFPRTTRSLLLLHVRAMQRVFPAPLSHDSLYCLVVCNLFSPCRYYCTIVAWTILNVYHRPRDIRDHLVRHDFFMNKPESVIICCPRRFALDNFPVAVADHLLRSTAC